MRKQFSAFVLRWSLNSLGLWIAVRLLGNLGADATSEETFWTFVFAGFIFSLVNSILKPILVILSLPAILLSLGLFMLVVNGVMVYIAVNLAPGIDMSFTASILAGIVMSLVNYVVTGLLEVKPQRGVR